MKQWSKPPTTGTLPRPGVLNKSVGLQLMLSFSSLSFHHPRTDKPMIFSNNNPPTTPIFSYPSISTSMESNSRNHNQEMANDEGLAQGQTSADSSSVSSDEDEEPEFQSMTAKGVQRLCSELLELKHESDDDFHKNIFSNYSAFLAILKEIDCLEAEVLRLKYQASSQRRIIQDIRDGISLRLLPEESTQSSVLEQILPDQLSILETHTENVSEIFDMLLLEHRSDDAIALLEMEAEFVQNVQSGENFSSDQLVSYNYIISEKKAMLADKLVSVAKHPRVSAPELQKSLIGLCQLGDNHLATQLMLQYYRSRIASGMSDLQSSKEQLPPLLFINKVTRLVCSMIAQAIGSFVALNGETYPYAPELTQWASEEIKRLAYCFCKYIESVSEISGRLSTAVDALQTAVSYCSLLESQRIFLQPCLAKGIRPCIEEVLRLHIDHLSRVISIFTSNETWALGRYYATGILTGQNCEIIDQQPEYFFFTNSGRKFATLFQSVVEDISPLIELQMERSVLQGIMNLFVAYIVILESAITGDVGATDQGCLRIDLSESPVQGVSVLANLSTLIQFFSSIVRKIFHEIHHLDFDINNHMVLIQDIYSRLKACFLDQFISNIFTPDADNISGTEICINRQRDLRIYDMIPSVPYLELHLELKKLQNLADDDSIDSNWLGSLLREVMDAVFNWISNKADIWRINKESLADHHTEIMQFILDAQFLVEVARNGGYLSDNVVDASSEIVSSVEAIFISAGQNPPRGLSDDEWPANTAIQALHKLQELHEKEALENENATSAGEESHILHVPKAGSEIPSVDNKDSAIENASDSDTDANQKMISTIKQDNGQRDDETIVNII